MDAPRRSSRSLAIAVVSVAAGIAVMAPPASSTPDVAGSASTTELYAAPDGSGDECSRAQPCALGTAQEQVRAATDDMDGDIVVNLLGGEYRRDAPWTLSSTDGDSGTGKHHVVYQAAEYGTESQHRPVISGGRYVTGWDVADADRNVWRAPADGLRTRQLYVDGRRAVRARQDAPIPGDVTTTDEGYVTTDSSMRSWRNPGQIEMAWLNGANSGGFQWAEPRCKVDDIVATGDTTKIVMAQPCYQRTTELRGERGITQPTSIENAYELLDEPGEWYVDEAADFLYYMPREGEEMAAADVVAPVLESLLKASGTANKPLRNVEFKGITFAEATYLAPESDEGFSEDAYNMIYEPLADGEEHNIFWSGFIKNVQMPANVTVGFSRNVRFEGNTFTRLGAAALTLDNGSQGSVVEGNLFTDISGQGVQVGNVDIGAESGPNLTTQNSVADNYFTDIGAEYRGAYATYIAAASHTTISHNYMGDLPRGGVANNHVYIRGDSINHTQRITNNVITDWGQVILDGGAIDTNGPQHGPDGKQPGSVIAGNVLAHATRGQGQIYLDNWSMGYTVENNIAYDNSYRSSLLRIVQRDSPCCNKLWHNYWDKPAAWGHTDSSVDNPVLPVEAMPASILTESGPRDDWFDPLNRAKRTTSLGALSLPAFPESGSVSAPVDVTVGEPTAGPVVPVSWTPGAGGDSATGFEVSCAEPGSEDYSVLAATADDATSAEVKGLVPGDVRTCVVRARNAGGALSEPSESVTVTVPGESNLAGSWSFDDDGGESAEDASGAGNDADLWNLVGRYEAEDGVLEGGVAAERMGYGFGQTSQEYYPANTGDAAVFRYRPPEASVTLDVDAPEAGSYTLDFRYSASREGEWDQVDGTRTLSLYVNGDRQEVRFPWTGSWGSPSNLKVEADLKAGANTIALKAEDGDHGWIVFDHMNVLTPANDARTEGVDGGQALALSGTTSASAGVEPVHDMLESSYSVSAWVRSSADGTQRLISKGFHNANAAGYALTMEDGALRFGVGSNWQERTNFTREPWEKTVSVATRRADFNDGEWHHVAVSVNTESEQLRIYVDGAAEPVQALSGHCASARGSVADISECTRAVAWSYDPLTIGSYDNTLDFAEGAIDEVAVYRQALSAGDIQQLAR